MTTNNNLSETENEILEKANWEKAFGKRPETGYEFPEIHVHLVDSEDFKGFSIAWLASGIGFGQYFFGWGMDTERLKAFPKQRGFYSDSECMGDEFVEALMSAAAPQLARLLIPRDIS